jgi:hypothetical protein
MLISTLLHVKDQVRSAPIAPFGTTSSLTSAVIMVITVNEKTPSRTSFFLSGKRKFHTIMIGIDITICFISRMKKTERSRCDIPKQSVSKSNAVPTLKAVDCAFLAAADEQYTNCVSISPYPRYVETSLLTYEM